MRTTDFMELNQVFTVKEFSRHLGRAKSLAEYRVRFFKQAAARGESVTLSQAVIRALIENLTVDAKSCTEELRIKKSPTP